MTPEVRTHSEIVRASARPGCGHAKNAAKSSTLIAKDRIEVPPVAAFQMPLLLYVIRHGGFERKPANRGRVLGAMLSRDPDRSGSWVSMLNAKQTCLPVPLSRAVKAPTEIKVR